MNLGMQLVQRLEQQCPVVWLKHDGREHPVMIRRGCIRKVRRLGYQVGTANVEAIDESRVIVQLFGLPDELKGLLNP